MKNKLINLEEFKSQLKDGISIMVGGFMVVGTPENLIDAVVESKIKDLTIICNDAGLPGKGVGKLIDAGQVKKLVASHIGLNPLAGKLMGSGDLEVELVPQGTQVERIRIAGNGIAGFYTPTGVGTMVEEGKEIKNIDGKDYILELPLRADIALLYGSTVDIYGNTLYTKTTRNFNPIMATACDKVYVQAREYVDSIDPDIVITPHIFIDYIIKEVA